MQCLMVKMLKQVEFLKSIQIMIIFKAIQNVYQNNADKINDYASLLFDQALLIEGLSIEDPVAFSNKICELMIELNK